MNCIKPILTILISVIISFAVNAQSASDMQLARQLAKQQGYSDSQIDAMIKQKQEQGTESKNTANSTNRDRNTGVSKQTDIQNQKNAYGVSGAQNTIYSNQMQGQQFVVGEQQMPSLKKDAIWLPGDRSEEHTSELQSH